MSEQEKGWKLLVMGNPDPMFPFDYVKIKGDGTLTVYNEVADKFLRASYVQLYYRLVDSPSGDKERRIRLKPASEMSEGAIRVHNTTISERIQYSAQGYVNSAASVAIESGLRYVFPDWGGKWGSGSYFVGYIPLDEDGSIEVRI